MSAEKVVICNEQELKSLPFGWCLETVIRRNVSRTIIAYALGALAHSAPRIYARVIEAEESPQMNEQQQEFMRWVLLNIHKPVGEWVPDDPADDATDCVPDDSDDD